MVGTARCAPLATLQELPHLIANLGAMRCSTRPPSAPLAEAAVVFRGTDSWSAPIHRDYTARQLHRPNPSKNAVVRSNRFSLPRVKPCSTPAAAHQNGG